MIRLRMVAIASNVVFVGYGLLGHLVPILVLAFLIRMVAQRAALDNPLRAPGAERAAVMSGFSRWLQ